jgi:virginiamycin B lyase
MHATRAASVAVAVALAGCGGGGSSAAPGRAPATTKQLPVTFAITVPRAGSATNGHRRRPAYISAATQSAVVDVTQAGAAATHTVIACTGSTCAGTVPATIGADTFSIALKDQLDGIGNTLATGQTTATVAEGQANAISVTFDGVIASVLVALAWSNPPVNSPATIKVNLTAEDADGKVIVGPGSYDNPILLSDSDTTGATKLSVSSVSSPNDPAPTVSYNGAWLGGESASATITASVPTNARVKPWSDALVPAPLITEFTIPTANAAPVDLTLGPDGALWFPENYGRKIGRMTTSGAFTEFPIPGAGRPWSIASGSDGNLYVAEETSFDQLTPAGVFTQHAIVASQFSPARYLPALISGADHNLWAADGSRDAIARFTPDGTETDFAIPVVNAQPAAITVGSDGALWFAQSNLDEIGRITTDGTITEYPILLSKGAQGGTSAGITSDQDGALWYTDGLTHAVGRMTTAGTGAEFPLSYFAHPAGAAIVQGPDGAIYVSDGTSQLVRISANGTFQAWVIPSIYSRRSGFTKFAIGPDGNIWYADQTGNVIGRIVL